MYAIIDIETTGSSYKNGKITEIAIFLHNGNEITGSFATLIDPEMDIPYFITRLTGITNEMVKGAPRFYEVARKIVELTAGRIFVAHHANFDYMFIREEFKRLGFTYQRKVLCTVKLARKYLPGFKTYSLGKLCENLGIPLENRHRAEGDAHATSKVFEQILKNHEALKYLSVFSQNPSF